MLLAPPFSVHELCVRLQSEMVAADDPLLVGEYRKVSVPFSLTEAARYPGYGLNIPSAPTYTK